MSAHAVPEASGGMLTANLMYFARVLRAAGLPIGPGRVLDAIEAVNAVGLDSRRDLYWTLHAVFVSHRRQREVFDQAFHVFWRNPRILERAMSLVLPSFRAPPADSLELGRRVTEALYPGQDAPERRDATEETEIHATMTWSDREQLQRKDFESMSAEEIEAARAAIARMRLAIRPVTTRRFRVHARGDRIHMRASLRRALRSGGDYLPLVRRRRRSRPPPLVVLCDISGSMTQYSRMLLHFCHALGAGHHRVESFVFGTRLTRITRYLTEKDVDVALERVSEAVVDWSGGTRIGACLHRFNRDWGRRVLGQGAVVLMITDGLDRDSTADLEAEAQRLHKSCRRLIWLNPLLRYEGFEPKAHGIRAILPHVDEFRTVHNLASLDALARALAAPPAGS